MDAAPRLRSLYRRMLRELPLRPSPATKLSDPSPLQRHIRATVQQQQPQPVDDGSVHARVSELEQFVAYAKAQRDYIALVERYNPGMNMSEEERVRLTARRVGMDTSLLPRGSGSGDDKS